MKMISVLPAALAALAAAYILIGAWLNHAFGADPSRRTPAAERGEGAHPLRLVASHVSAAIGSGALAALMAGEEAGNGFILLCAVLGGMAIGGAASYGALFICVRRGGEPLYDALRDAFGGSLSLAFLANVFLSLTVLTGMSTALAAECAQRAASVYDIWMPRYAWTAGVMLIGLLLSCVSGDGLRRAGGALCAALTAALAGAILLGTPVDQSALGKEWIAPGMGAKQLLTAAACGVSTGLHGVFLAGSTAQRIASERHMRTAAYGGTLLMAAICAIALGTSGVDLSASLAFSLGIPQEIVVVVLLMMNSLLSLYALQASLRSVRSLAHECRRPALPGMKPRMDWTRLAPVASFALCAVVALAGMDAVITSAVTALLLTSAFVCALVCCWMHRVGRRGWPYAVLAVLLGILGFAADLRVFYG